MKVRISISTILLGALTAGAALFVSHSAQSATTGNDPPFQVLETSVDEVHSAMKSGRLTFLRKVISCAAELRKILSHGRQ